MYCITYPFKVCTIIQGRRKKGTASQTENEQGDAVCFSNLSSLKRHNYPKKPWLIGEMLYYVQIIKHPDLAKAAVHLVFRSRGDGVEGLALFLQMLITFELNFFFFQGLDLILGAFFSILFQTSWLIQVSPAGNKSSNAYLFTSLGKSTYLKSGCRFAPLVSNAKVLD